MKEEMTIVRDNFLIGLLFVHIEKSKIIAKIKEMGYIMGLFEIRLFC